MKPRPFKLPSDWLAIKKAEDGIMVVSKDGLRALASWGLGWEHVSVSKQDRCPTWDEMCRVKSLFWEEEECVIQYHPPKSMYRNFHPYCLHLWRPTDKEIPMPLPEMIA